MYGSLTIENESPSCGELPVLKPICGQIGLDVSVHGSVGVFVLNVQVGGGWKGYYEICCAMYTCKTRRCGQWCGGVQVKLGPMPVVNWKPASTPSCTPWRSISP